MKLYNAIYGTEYCQAVSKKKPEHGLFSIAENPICGYNMFGEVV